MPGCRPTPVTFAERCAFAAILDPDRCFEESRASCFPSPRGRRWRRARDEGRRERELDPSRTSGAANSSEFARLLTLCTIPARSSRVDNLQSPDPSSGAAAPPSPAGRREIGHGFTAKQVFPRSAYGTDSAAPSQTRINTGSFLEANEPRFAATEGKKPWRSRKASGRPAWRPAR